jgi:predicted ArsR family transcriptional regulator
MMVKSVKKDVKKVSPKAVKPAEKKAPAEKTRVTAEQRRSGVLKTLAKAGGKWTNWATLSDAIGTISGIRTVMAELVEEGLATVELASDNDMGTGHVWQLTAKGRAAATKV